MLTRLSDRIRLKQEDAPLNAIGPQSFPRAQHQGRRSAPHAQHDICRRVNTPSNSLQSYIPLTQRTGSDTPSQHARESKSSQRPRLSVSKSQTQRPESRPSHKYFVLCDLWGFKHYSCGVMSALFSWPIWIKARLYVKAMESI